MPQIPPITDAYIDEIIKAPDAYNPTLNKTQGVKLRELIKLMRDKLDQTSSGTYTPTLRDLTDNLPVTPYLSHYIRIGSEVTVIGRLAISSDLERITVSISLPIASALTSFDDASGMAMSVSSEGFGEKPGDVYYDIDVNSVILDVINSYTTSNSVRFNFTYSIK